MFSTRSSGKKKKSVWKKMFGKKSDANETETTETLIPKQKDNAHKLTSLDELTREMKDKSENTLALTNQLLESSKKRYVPANKAKPTAHEQELERRFQRDLLKRDSQKEREKRKQERLETHRKGGELKLNAIAQNKTIVQMEKRERLEKRRDEAREKLDALEHSKTKSDHENKIKKIRTDIEGIAQIVQTKATSNTENPQKLKENAQHNADQTQFKKVKQKQTSSWCCFPFSRKDSSNRNKQAEAEVFLHEGNYKRMDRRYR